MKNKHLPHLFTAMTLLSSLVALNSCSHNELDELSSSVDAPQGETVTLQIAGTETRTALEEGGRVVWSEGDYVNINGIDYPVIPNPEDPTCASIPNVAASDSYVGLYGGANISHNGQLFHSFANLFYYTRNSFDREDNLMIAYSTGDEPLFFRNMGAVLKFGLTGNSNITISQITLTTDRVPLQFQIDVNDLANGGLGMVFDPESWTDHFVMECDTPVRLHPDTPCWFYFCLPPATYANGFQFTINSSDGQSMTKQTSSGNSYTIESGKIYTLPAISCEISSDAIPLEATIDNATGPFVQYTLSCEPNSTAIAKIMRKQEFDQTTPETLLDALKTGLSVQFDAEGHRSMQSLDPIPASTECVLVYAYLDDNQITGIPEVLPFRTNDAQQPAPGLTVTKATAPSPSSQYAVNIRTEAPSEAIKLMVILQSEYDRLMTEYGSPLDLFFSPAFSSSSLTEEILSQVATTEGYDMLVGNTLTPVTDYMLLALAYGADGAIYLLEHPFTTEAYLDPEATWVTVSTSATMECGIFTPLGINHLQIEKLTVDKLEDRDLFRIVDPFALDRVPELANSDYGLTEASDEPYYMLIDATNPDDVIVDIGVNQLNLLIWGTTPMSIATYNHMVGVEALYPSIYDAANGTIQFPEGSLVIMINGLYQCAATTIHLNR